MASWKDRLALTARRNRLEIIKAKLSRRDMIRMGLLTAGGTLVIKQGLSSRAFADGGGPSSPPIQNPFVQEMPRLPVLPGFTDPNQFARGGPPIADRAQQVGSEPREMREPDLECCFFDGPAHKGDRWAGMLVVGMPRAARQSAWTI